MTKTKKNRRKEEDLLLEKIETDNKVLEKLVIHICPNKKELNNL